MKLNEDYREQSPVFEDHIERYMYRKAAIGGWYVIDQDEPATVLCFVIGKEDAEQIVFALNYAEEFCR